MVFEAFMGVFLTDLRGFEGGMPPYMEERRVGGRGL